MDNITNEDVPVGLVEADPLLNGLHALSGVVEDGASVAGCHSIAQVLRQGPLVLQEVTLKFCSTSTCHHIIMGTMPGIEE